MRLGLEGLRLALAAVVAAVVVNIASPVRADSVDGRWANDSIERAIKLAVTDTPRRTARSGSSASRATRTSSRSTSRRGRQTYATLATYDERPAARRRAPVTGGGGVRWVANSGCLVGSLRSIVSSLASSFGPLTVNSTCRSRSHNRRVGGASRSYHLTGNAVDFRIHQNVGAAYASLRSSGAVGGLKHYGRGLFHIDTGPRRGW